MGSGFELIHFHGMLSQFVKLIVERLNKHDIARIPCFINEERKHDFSF